MLSRATQEAADSIRGFYRNMMRRPAYSAVTMPSAAASQIVDTTRLRPRMKRVYCFWIPLHIALGGTLVWLKRRRRQNGLRITWEDAQAAILGRGFAVQTSRTGVAVIIIDRMLTPRDTIGGYKWGYLPEKFSFTEDSDGKKSVVLKTGPDPGPNPQEVAPQREEKKRKNRK